MKRITILSALIILSLNVFAQKERIIKVDFQKEKSEFIRSFNKCVGAGRANEGLRADWQEQLRMAKKECGFDYIRFHGIFHDDMGVYFENRRGKAVYNWQYIDKLYDFLLSINVKPFIELSFMPTDLADGKKTVFWWKANISKPKSYEIYYDFIKSFTQHLTDRYGAEEVKTWYFEVWNEPDLGALFFDGKFDDYCKIYSTAVKAIRSVNKDYVVGGPSSANWWIDEFMAYCKKNNTPLDFISTHGYNCDGFFDQHGDRRIKMGKDPLAVAKKVKHVRKEVDRLGGKDLEIHFTEWSSSYSSFDPIHDSYQNATFVLNTLKQTDSKATSMSYWAFTDIFEEQGPAKVPFHGQFGLMNIQGLKKPTYFAYKYLNQLGNVELINKDEKSWVTKKGDDLQILAWDFTYLDQGKEPNDVFYRRDLKPAKESKLKLKTKNLKNGVYELLVYKTGYRQNDVFTFYRDLGLPGQLTSQEVETLRSFTSDDPIERKIVKIENNKINLNYNLRENDIILIKLNRIKDVVDTDKLEVSVFEKY